MLEVGSALGYGGIVMVIGMLIVFVGLTILILCVSLMGKIFKSINQKKKAVTPEAAPAAAPAPVAEAAPAADPMQDPQLIAVIAAALAAYDKSGKQLVIKKVRRVSAWNGAARSEQVYRF